MKKIVNVAKQEISIDKQEIQTTRNTLKNISVRLNCCKNQKFFLNESVGEAATQAKRMYDEVLYVAGVLQELVEQTASLLDNTIVSFEEAEKHTITKYIEKI